MVNICYFGTYEKNFPRNRTFINSLKKIDNFYVHECHFPLWEKTDDKTGSYFNVSSLINTSLNLVHGYTRLIRTSLPSIKKSDFLVVGYIGQLDLIVLKFLNIFYGKKIIFNPMISLYDTLILDRKIIKNKVFSYLIWLLDKMAFEFSDLIILDTPSNSDYIRSMFNMKSNKFDYIYIGADENLFYPMKIKNIKNDSFNVLFYGKFTPLHGVDYIIKAAKILEKYEDIYFTIIGKGQEYAKMMELVKTLNVTNIEFIEWVRFEDLPKYIAKADLCLGGHFGGGEKARKVIANKTFQMIAMGKPVLVGRNRANEEGGFIDGENCLMCSMQNESDIASKVYTLRINTNLAKNLSLNSFKLYNEKFSESVMRDRLKRLFVSTII